MSTDDDWRADGLCAQTDPEAFFPDKGGSVAAAKATCRRCDVAAQCLQYALDNAEPSGVWGGLSPQERKALAKKRGAPGPTGPRRGQPQHGTHAGARRHRRAGERPCPECLAAETRYHTERAALRRREQRLEGSAA